MGKPLALTGQRFGRIVVLRRVNLHCQFSKWECRCDCGKICVIAGSALNIGRTKSCGCFRREFTRKTWTTHGEYRRPEYRIWAAMIERTENPRSTYWEDYGGRGIKVCKEWRDSYPKFLADVGRRPSPKHSIDRFPDNDGNYEPGNVRWATPIEQGSNKRNNRLITLNGVTHTVAEWARVKNMNVGSLKTRLNLGWVPQDALTTPLKPGVRGVRPISSR